MRRVHYRLASSDVCMYVWQIYMSFITIGLNIATIYIYRKPDMFQLTMASPYIMMKLFFVIYPYYNNSELIRYLKNK